MTEEHHEEEQVKEPSDVEDAMDLFQKEQAEKPSEKETEEKETKEEPCETCETEEKETEEPKKIPFYIVDEQGNKTPLVFKADGKEHIPDSIEKVLTWGNLGIHANTRLEKIKESEGMLQKIFTAIEKGQLSIKPPEKPSEKEEVKADEDTYQDPELVEEKKKREKLEGDFKSLKKVVIEKMIMEQKDIIQKQIDEFLPKFPLAEYDTERIWGLLGETKEDNSPKYDIEACVKMVHEREEKKINDYAEKHPELKKADKEKTVAEYLKTKEEKEKAPVGSPSEEPTGTTPTSAKKEYKGMDDAVKDMKKFLSSQKEAGQKA